MSEKSLCFPAGVLRETRRRNVDCQAGRDGVWSGAVAAIRTNFGVWEVASNDAGNSPLLVAEYSHRVFVEDGVLLRAVDID